MRTICLAALIVIAFAIACEEPERAVPPTAAPLPTYTPLPTHTPVPTQIPAPTYTPYPTYTTIPIEMHPQTHRPPKLPKTPTRTSTPIPTPTSTPTSTPTPTPFPQLVEPDIGKTWGRVELFSLLKTVIDRPVAAAQYVGQTVSIRETFSSQSSNIVSLWWEYAHDELLERSFGVRCKIDPVTDSDLVILKQLSDLEEADEEPLVQVQGTIGRHFINANPIEIRDGGLSMSIHLNDCKVIGIGSEIVSAN